MGLILKPPPLWAEPRESGLVAVCTCVGGGVGVGVDVAWVQMQMWMRLYAHLLLHGLTTWADWLGEHRVNAKHQHLVVIYVSPAIQQLG